MPKARKRHLTSEEKEYEVHLFKLLREAGGHWRREHPDKIGGEGYIDHEVIPLVDSLNAIDGVCTLQSCCGHVNRHGYPCQGQLWIRLSSIMSVVFDARVRELVEQDVIYRVRKQYNLMGGDDLFEVIDIEFHGEAGTAGPVGAFGGPGPSRMAEAESVLLEFFSTLLQSAV